MTTLFERWFEKVAKHPSGCWMWRAGTNAKGYGRLQERVGGRGYNRHAHRLAYEFYRGPIPEGAFVLHSCDTPACVNPWHLRVGSNQDNMDDMVHRGRSSRLCGESNGRSKLTEVDARAIRASTESTRKAGRRYGVSHAVVHDIRQGRRWGHVS